MIEKSITVPGEVLDRSEMVIFQSRTPLFSRTELTFDRSLGRGFPHLHRISEYSAQSDFSCFLYTLSVRRFLAQMDRVNQVKEVKEENNHNE